MKAYSKYKLEIHEVGKSEADIIFLSAEEYLEFSKAYSEQNYFMVMVDSEERFYNIPLLSSIKITKMAEAE